MKIQYKKNALEIYRNNKLESLLKKQIFSAFEKNKKLFKKNPKKVKIFVCDTEEEFKKYSKYFYFSHAAGTCLRTGEVNVRSNNLVLKKFGFKMLEKDYENFLAHEINHSFWFQFFKTQKPVWLSESLANIIQGRLHYNREGDFFNLDQTKKFIKKNKWDFSKIKYHYIKKDLNTREKVRQFYSVLGHFAEFISNKKPKKIIEFMFEYSKNPEKDNYNILFKKYFGNSVKNKFDEFFK